MKSEKIIFYILMFLPLPATLISLLFLPDQIPAHYGFDNQVTRWGSKYEILIFPAFTILFGFFMLAMAKFSAKQEKSEKGNEKICIIKWKTYLPCPLTLCSFCSLSLPCS